MGLWQEEAQELEAALGAFPSSASSVFGESRGEFLLVLPFLLCASSPGCVLYFLTPVLGSLGCASPAPPGPSGEPDQGTANPGYF